MKIITAAVIKGGTGKTTTIAALAQAAACNHKKVLAIDLDPQGNLTHILAGEMQTAGSYEVLTGRSTIEDAIQETPQNIDLLSASADLSTVKTAQGSAKTLKKALQPIQDNYDLIVIDTPPQIGNLTYNGLYASTGVIIPLEADYNSLQGMYQVSEIAQHLKQDNPDITILGTIITRYDNRPKINQYFKAAINDRGNEIGAPLLRVIRPSTAIREAQALQVSLYEYNSTCKPATDYMALYNDIAAD